MLNSDTWSGISEAPRGGGAIINFVEEKLLQFLTNENKISNLSGGWEEIGIPHCSGKNIPPGPSPEFNTVFENG